MKNTKLIITGGPRDNWDLPLRSKLNILYESVDQDFNIIYSFNDWSVYLRK
tara:strand:+ start:389 stop:541 length:153 start_codon:yes stop_codon:yes gene_type:complete